MNNSQDIQLKQHEIYQSTLAAFILQSRKMIAEQRMLYQSHVLRNFASIENDSTGGYNLRQKGKPLINIRQASTVNQRNMQLR